MMQSIFVSQMGPFDFIKILLLDSAQCLSYLSHFSYRQTYMGHEVKRKVIILTPTNDPRIGVTRESRDVLFISWTSPHVH